jgi:hypothetical protein
MSSEHASNLDLIQPYPSLGPRARSGGHRGPPPHHLTQPPPDQSMAGPRRRPAGRLSLHPFHNILGRAGRGSSGKEAMQDAGFGQRDKASRRKNRLHRPYSWSPSFISCPNSLSPVSQSLPKFQIGYQILYQIRRNCNLEAQIHHIILFSLQACARRQKPNSQRHSPRGNYAGDGPGRRGRAPAVRRT